MTLTFKRQEAGNYVAQSKAGFVEIQKGNDGKWYIHFPDGKESYRSSYSGAKSWSETYVARLEENKAVVKQAVDQARASKKEQTLKEKLAPNNSIVWGAEPLGCINTGRCAAINHLNVEGKSYYLVGFDGDITDNIFEKNRFQIGRKILKGIVENFTCKNGNVIRVYNSFAKAEKDYLAMNQKQKDSNNEDRMVVAKAQAKIKAGTATAKEYFTLSDYGVI